MQILFQTLFVLLILYSASVVGHWIYFVYCPLSWLWMKLNTAVFRGFSVVLIRLFLSWLWMKLNTAVFRGFSVLLIRLFFVLVVDETEHRSLSWL